MGGLANLAVSTKTFTSKIASALAQKVPVQMKDKGITAAARVCFQKRQYVVIEVEIREVDIFALIEGKVGQERYVLTHISEQNRFVARVSHLRFF